MVPESVGPTSRDTQRVVGSSKPAINCFLLRLLHQKLLHTCSNALGKQHGVPRWGRTSVTAASTAAAFASTASAILSQSSCPPQIVCYSPACTARPRLTRNTFGRFRLSGLRRARFRVACAVLSQSSCAPLASCDTTAGRSTTLQRWNATHTCESVCLHSAPSPANLSPLSEGNGLKMGGVMPTVLPAGRAPTK